MEDLGSSCEADPGRTLHDPEPENPKSPISKPISDPRSMCFRRSDIESPWTGANREAQKLVFRLMPGPPNPRIGFRV